MSRYLLDTNTASYVIKGSVPAVRSKLLKIPVGQVGISSVTEAELRYGVAQKPEAIRLAAIVEEFLRLATIHPWDSSAAREYGRLRASLEAKGRPLGNLDMMIGAHARALGCILVTSDRAFANIPHLKIEDWTLGP
jgi:tRNA(fMet)-specific endonuclease VapC